MAAAYESFSDESDNDYMDTSGSESEFSDSELSSESEADEVTDARVWCRENLEIPQIPAAPRFDFTGHSSVNYNVDFDKGVLQFFNIFFDDDLMEEISNETNLYAEQCISAARVERRAKMRKAWRPTNSSELRVFLAIVIAQSVVRKPSYEMFWSKDPITTTPFFAKTMSKCRFKIVKQYLHFSDNTKYVPEMHPNPKLNKIWPVYKNISDKFKQIYIPERDITIDESLMLFKGRLGWVQYIPLKRSRFGIKTYMLCESESGYVWSFIIYTGKGTNLNAEYQHLNMGSQVVMTLMNPLLNLGYCLTTDNFYTSPQLADLLISKKTDTYGTVRLNRKEMPELLQKSKLKKGQMVACRRGKVVALKWKDKKDVSLLSSVHNAEMVDTVKRGKIIRKPKMVVDYNDTMGGVDRVDQHLADYPLPRKRSKKYYKKIFSHILDLTLWNAYLIHSKTGGNKSPLQFRMALITELVEKYFNSEDTPRAGRPSSENAMLPHRLSGKHFPEFIPPTEKRANPTRQCVLCSRMKDARGKKIRRETRYQCDECNVSLCVVGCFRKYHSDANIHFE